MSWWKSEIYKSYSEMDFYNASGILDMKESPGTILSSGLVINNAKFHFKEEVWSAQAPSIWMT